MPAPKKRIKKNKGMDINNQYLNALFSEFIEERKALGRVEETLKSYKATYKKFCDYFGDRADEAGNIYGSMFIEWTGLSTFI